MAENSNCTRIVWWRSLING